MPYSSDPNQVVQQRSPKKILRVTFPNGTSICYNNATATYIETLKQIGADKFPLITLELGHLPLISRTKHTKYASYMKPIVDGWYLNTQSDTEQKYLQLRSISDMLHLGLNVEIGRDFEITNENTQKLNKSEKESLLIQFPDGEFIAECSPVETYIQSIWKIGIDNIQRKDIRLSDKPLITRKKQYPKQIQVGSDQWLVVPGTTKEKAKWLRIIASMMHIDLKISVI